MPTRSATAAYKSRSARGTRVRIECLFFGPFREDVGEETIRRETDAETLGQLRRELEADYPAPEGRLVAGDELAGRTCVTKAKKDVRHLEGLETPLEEGDPIQADAVAVRRVGRCRAAVAFE